MTVNSYKPTLDMFVLLTDTGFPHWQKTLTEGKLILFGATYRELIIMKIIIETFLSLSIHRNKSSSVTPSGRHTCNKGNWSYQLVWLNPPAHALQRRHDQGHTTMQILKWVAKKHVSVTLQVYVVSCVPSFKVNQKLWKKFAPPTCPTLPI